MAMMLVLANEIFVFPPQATLSLFKDIWLNSFLFGLYSSLFVHGIAAGIAFIKLRKHPRAIFFPILILIVGVISPLTYGVISNAAFAGVLKAAQFDLAPIYCLAWGVVQTFSIVFISFTRLLFTL
ncbi:hypothetical protein EB796_024579 [Bugula neritina]|uniref:Uncharacterized protein n=1 Tax=Bugula neritina TaxID=10212 RepID=A0A7J7IV87_BUGNE|nr:hypothetical protein EB796_024579 [Bugula neritina]